MIRLHPLPEADLACPHCQVNLEVQAWYIPGMRNLADLRCPKCGRKFWGDLPAGHALYSPLLLDQADGKVHGACDAPWFADWLKSSFARRTGAPIGFHVESFRPVKEPVLLNCLDRLYGHCLLKLLNAQYYLDERKDLDLIVMVSEAFRWLVPDGVAEVWSVELPLARGGEWNDWLGAEIRRRLELFRRCWLSVAFSHPHPEDYDIERFSRVRPFSTTEWDKSLDRPTVTFIWRADRLWVQADTGLLNRGLRRLGLAATAAEEQERNVVSLAQGLQAVYPRMDFAVAGLGSPGGLPSWVQDLRTSSITDSVERSWCERYARSHIVIGVHGSNMLLPSAHAGATIELMPQDRWGNLAEDILTNAHDPQDIMYRYRFLSLNTSPAVLARVAASLMISLPYAILTFRRPWNHHEYVQRNPCLLARANSGSFICSTPHDFRPGE